LQLGANGEGIVPTIEGAEKKGSSNISTARKRTYIKVSQVSIRDNFGAEAVEPEKSDCVHAGDGAEICERKGGARGTRQKVAAFGI